MKSIYEIRVSDARGGSYVMRNGSPQPLQVENRSEFLGSMGCPQHVIDKTGPTYERRSRNVKVPVCSRNTEPRWSGSAERDALVDALNQRRAAAIGIIVRRDEEEAAKLRRWSALRGY